MLNLLYCAKVERNIHLQHITAEQKKGGNMRITVLVENTSVSEVYGHKHGLSLYIEAASHKILFDLGSDDLFAVNAEKMGIDLGEVDTVVISHGHDDHGGALERFFELNHTAKVYIQENAFGAYYQATFEKLKKYIGLNQELKDSDRIVLLNGECRIDEHISLFSKVPLRYPVPRTNSSLYVKKREGYLHDDFSHEQNMLVKEEGRVYLFAGCAHNGIMNILECAEQVGGKSVDAVFGGFHLYNQETQEYESESFIALISQLLRKKTTIFYTCHCTGEKAYGQLKEILHDQMHYIRAGEVIQL